MNNLKNLLEKQNQIWLVIIGLVLIVYGVYEFQDIASKEASGQPVRMKKIMQYIYQAGGKYTILSMFEIVGIISLMSGILQLRKKI